MSTLEIILLRSVGKPLDELKASIGRDENFNTRVKIYLREAIESDLSIHIHHNLKQEGSPSIIACRLASALRAYGLVEQTVWNKSE